MATQCRELFVSLRKLAPWLAGMLIAAAGKPACAYSVRIDAPAPLQELLREHLDLMRYRERDDVDAQLFNFMVNTAHEQVAELAATEGYFSTRTSVAVERARGEPLVRVSVVPGPRTRVAQADIGVRGAAIELAPRQVAQMQREWDLPVGAPFRQADWADAKEEALRQLQRRRFPAARLLDSQARILADEQRAQLSVAYDSGPLFTFGKPTISGAERYPESIIGNLNPLLVGEQYSLERLLEYQRQLLRTPYYSNAVVDLAIDPDAAREAPVRVQVSEFPRQRLRGGFGYTTDTGAHLAGRYTNLSMLRPALVLDTELIVEQERQLGDLSLTLPPRPGGFVLGMLAQVEHTTLEGIDQLNRRIGVRRTRTGDRRDTTYALTYYQDRLKRLNDAPLPPTIVIAPGDHKALVLAGEKVWRRVDDPVFPRSGHIYTAQIGVALKGVLSDQTFMRAYTRARYFFPVRQRDILILRAELGAVLGKGGTESVPASLLFRAGGTDSVRGYAYQGIGTVRDGTVYPARLLLTASAEYQYWLSQRWGVALFYDAGIAADRWDEQSLFHAVGVGARLRTPVGRLRVDLAYGFRDQKFRPHLSLGIAF